MIKERVMEFLEKQCIPKENFFSKIEMSSSNFRGTQKKCSLNSDAIAKIFALCPDMNLEWLITGSGPMLKSQLPHNQDPNKLLLDKIVELSAENGALKAQLEEAKKRNDETKSA